ncbi:hypothetical protein ACNO7T_08060 [Vibrio campbellii]
MLNLTPKLFNHLNNAVCGYSEQQCLDLLSDLGEPRDDGQSMHRESIRRLTMSRLKQHRESASYKRERFRKLLRNSNPQKVQPRVKSSVPPATNTNSVAGTSAFASRMERLAGD